MPEIGKQFSFCPRVKAARMQKRTKLQQQLLIASCTGLIVASAGCRSSMPKWNMFGGKAPSAETLAGAGPTITYPAPPSESATPDAIASVAGGTAESTIPSANLASTPPTIAPVSGFDATSREDLASAVTNNAAARANGFNLASNRTTSDSTGGGMPGYAAPSSKTTKSNSAVPAIPTGYKLGTQKSATGTTKSSGSSYVMPSAYPAPGVTPAGGSSGSPYALPNASAPIIPMKSASNTTTGFGLPATAAVAPTASSSTGFSMPDSTAPSSTPNATSPANAQPFTPKPTATTASAMMAPPAGITSGTTQATPASTVSTGTSTPSFSTASAELAPRSSGAPKNGGYAPGSTSSSGSYPTTSGYPSTGTDGSFYR